MSAKTPSHCTVTISLHKLSFFEVDHSLVWQFYKAAIMEKSKTGPFSNTVVFSSIIFSVAVCFVALIHVEVELHAHRQMLQVLTQQNGENLEIRSTVNRHEETIGSVLKMLHSDAGKGENKRVFSGGFRKRTPSGCEKGVHN